MSANTFSPVAGQLELPIVEIDTDSVTVLVGRKNSSGHAGSSAIYAGYPVYLDTGATGVTKQIGAICVDEMTAPSSLEVVGIEFDDPEQYNTAVTLDREALAQVVWSRTDTATGQVTALMRGIPDIMELPGLVDTSGHNSISVPIYIS